MNLYAVMLEGRDAEKPFFVTFDVVSTEAEEAVALAKARASADGLDIVRLEEVSPKEASLAANTAEVVKVYGRAFFDEA